MEAWRLLFGLDAIVGNLWCCRAPLIEGILYSTLGSQWGNFMSLFEFDMFRQPIRQPMMPAILVVSALSAGWNLTGNFTKPKSLQDVAAMGEAATVYLGIITADGTPAGCAGFFFNRRGDILTAKHCVNEGIRSIKVEFIEGKKIVEKVPTVTYVDKQYDFAVLHADGVKNHPYVALGDSNKLKSGDQVLMIGFPFDMGLTVNAGIVSQPVQVYEGKPYVQYDAPSNPGDSGGMVVSVEQGKVIGVGSSLMNPSEFGKTNTGVTMAVPSSLIRWQFDQLRF